MAHDGGSDSFWAFVAKVDWAANWNSPLSSFEQMMRSTWSVEEIKLFEQEYRALAKRIKATIDTAPGVDFGGGDDHTFMDLPGEVIGRGKQCYLEHADNVEKLSQFGQSESVHEGMAYLFQPFNEGAGPSLKLANAAARKTAPGCGGKGKGKGNNTS